jgi:hypothetical protein
MQRLMAETVPAECDFVQVIPLDGLRIKDASEVPLPGARLVKFSAEEWAAFFEAPLFQSADVSTLTHLWAVEIRGRRALQNPNGLWIHLEEPRRHAMDLVGRWVHCINLVSGGFVRPLAIHTKLDTRLALRPVDTIRVAEPLTLSRTDGQDEWEEPFVSVDAPDAAGLSATIAALDKGHETATALGPRVDTALHWFARVADQVYGWELGSTYDEALHEDIVPDCFTALEALLLRPKESGKGPNISARAASLIAEDDAKVETLRKEILAAYKVRNDLVHGDAEPSASDLSAAAKRLPIWVKQVTAALLRLGGNLDAVIRGVSDAGTRVANRALVPRY